MIKAFRYLLVVRLLMRVYNPKRSSEPYNLIVLADFYKWCLLTSNYHTIWHTGAPEKMYDTNGLNLCTGKDVCHFLFDVFIGLNYVDTFKCDVSSHHTPSHISVCVKVNPLSRSNRHQSQFLPCTCIHRYVNCSFFFFFF